MFKLVSDYKPTGDQPQAIEKLSKGIEEGKIKVATKLLELDYDIEDIQKITELPKEEIERLKNTKTKQ